MRALLALLFLGACASAPPAAEAPTREDTCGIAAHRHLMGAAGAGIDRSRLPPQTRIVGPRDAMTMDYSEQRLNIILDESGRVTDLRCF